MTSALDIIGEALCPPSHREGWFKHIVGNPPEWSERRVCVLHSAQARNVLDALSSSLESTATAIYETSVGEVAPQLTPGVKERCAAAWEQGYLRGVLDETSDLERADNPYLEAS